jgi:transglutaminase-like putative cysteine protease
MITALAMTACIGVFEEDLTGTVSIDGTAEVGETLTANTDLLDGEGTISYQWKRGNENDNENPFRETPIGTNSETYVIQPEDEDSTITVTVTRLGYYGSVTSEPTEIVTDSRPKLTGTESISGTAEVGKKLTANIGSLGGTGTVSYQWKRGAGGTITDIGTESTYTVQPSDAGSTITVTVTRSGYKGVVSSLPTATVTDTRPEHRKPYFYPGTGKTYDGFVGTEGTLTTRANGVTVTYPSETTFSADGFFTLEGSIVNPPSYNYAYIEVTKDSDHVNLTTSYFVRNNFKQRIWLRFGSGAYTISVWGITSGGFDNLEGDGDLVGSFSFSGLITYKVTNTRDEGDMRFLYPSSVVQSDDKIVTDLADKLTSGLTDDTAKIKAIHDYIIKNTVYDQMSRVAGKRKKQDALTVLGTRYSDAPYDTRYIGGHFLAVCEGYSNTFSALARAVGIQTRYVSSRSMNHGWNNVLVDGKWKFIDVTWDDPTREDSSSTNVVDWGPDYVRDKYFLLDTMDGVDNDHSGGVVNNERSLIKDSTLPWQHGLPDGWY